MKFFFITLSIGCLFLAAGCNSFRTGYFGVEDKAIHSPGDFGKTQKLIEKAKRHGDSLYAEKQIDKAMELGKTAAITYWEGYDQEAKNILALAREAALNSELYHPQPMPPDSKRAESIAGILDSPERIDAGETDPIAPNDSSRGRGFNRRAELRITQKTQTEPRAQAPQPDQSPARYGVQVAALKQPDNADFVKEKFTAKGYPVYRQKAEVDGETWYRVRLGPYANAEKAQETLEQIKSSGLAKGGFVVKTP
ncbi:MAG: SPOR domain-containing protein [Desulfobacterales bacterium]|nr:SPOR domain-containing protein [Desulfobacterales bacterium]